MHRLLVPLLALAPSLALAGEARVLDAEATALGGLWRFTVTVAHEDAGWAHYADAWEVLAPDGTRLGLRELLHPHDTEQPFTRALDDVTIPTGIAGVQVRARDNVHGWGPVYSLPLPE